MALHDDILIEIQAGNIPEKFTCSDLKYNLCDKTGSYKVGNRLYKKSSITTTPSNLRIDVDGSSCGNHVKNGAKPQYIRISSGLYILNLESIDEKNHSTIVVDIKSPKKISSLITKDQIAKDLVTIGKSMNIENYEIEHHKHILAVWAAGTAANNSIEFRFSVEFGKKLLLLGSDKNSENSFIEHIEEVRSMTTQESFDAWHHSTISAMIDSEKVKQLVNEQNIAKGKNLISENYSYGIAAKLLNVYLKVYFLGEFSKKPFADYIHPPIDRLLLKQLKKLDRNRFSFLMDDFKGHKLTNGLPAWTQLTFNQYEDILQRVKSHINERDVVGLWKIEYAWKGHQ